MSDNVTFCGVCRKKFDSIISGYESSIEKYACQMEDDYESFFKLHSGEVYKAKLILKVLGKLDSVIEWSDIVSIKTYLGIVVKDLEYHLITGSQYPANKDPMANVAEIIERIARQELREELEHILTYIEIHRG